MAFPTWGRYIPGYSSPSPKQAKLYKRLYPEAAAHAAIDEERERALTLLVAAKKKRLMRGN